MPSVDPNNSHPSGYGAPGETMSGGGEGEPTRQTMGYSYYDRNHAAYNPFPGAPYSNYRYHPDYYFQAQQNRRNLGGPYYPMQSQTARGGAKGANPAASQSTNKEPNTGNNPNMPSSDALNAARDLLLERKEESELTVEDITPIQTDFHFFVQEHKPKLLPQVEKEVDQSIKQDQTMDAAQRQYLIGSNLNCRLMTLWEQSEQRDQYFKQEEDDRVRFMEDEEIASRHCFTLTARLRNPKKEEGEEGVGVAETELPVPPDELKRSSPSNNNNNNNNNNNKDEESPTKKSKPEPVTEGRV